MAWAGIECSHHVHACMQQVNNLDSIKSLELEHGGDYIRPWAITLFRQKYIYFNLTACKILSQLSKHFFSFIAFLPIFVCLSLSKSLISNSNFFLGLDLYGIGWRRRGSKEKGRVSCMQKRRICTMT